MEELTFRHSLPIQLRFNDVDKFGHVNNSVYFSYYDLGKTEYFTTVRPDLDWEKEGIVVVHIEVDFLAQIFATDPITVETTVAEIGTKSMKLIQRVVDNKGEVKCVCQSILVAFNLEKHESQEISEEWIESISAYERRDVRKKKADQWSLPIHAVRNEDGSSQLSDTLAPVGYCPNRLHKLPGELLNTEQRRVCHLHTHAHALPCMRP